VTKKDVVKLPIESAQSQASSLQNQLSAAQSAQNQLQSQANNLRNQLASTAGNSAVSIRLAPVRGVSIIVGGTFRTTLTLNWTSTNATAAVDLEVRSDGGTFRRFTKIATNQRASGTYDWNARGVPGEGFTFRAVARVNGRETFSNTQFAR